VERSLLCKLSWWRSRSKLTDSLGGSGSGKTTLLNAVAHRLGGLPVEDGEVSYHSSTGETDQVKLGKAEVKRRLGFVRQQDFLVECLTGMSLLHTALRYLLTPQFAKRLHMYISSMLIRDAADDLGGKTSTSGQSLE
jgi:ABC-type multidrug transport system ATPase subunit